MTENIQLQPTTILTGRPPLSVLAVRPKTRAPPPLLIPSRSPAPPTIPTRGILPVPTGPVVPTLPKLPQPTSTIISPSNLPKSPSMTQLSTVQAFNVEREGILLPIIPIPYEPVLIKQQGNTSSILPSPSVSSPLTNNSTVTPGLRVVVPTVSQSYIPKVVQEVVPRSPPQSPPPQSLIRGPITAAPPPNLPTSPIYRAPATMTGSNPPIGEEEPVLVPVTNYTLSPQGLVAYSSPIDVASFSISQESAPLPIQESLTPTILSSQLVSVPVPSYRSEGTIPTTQGGQPKVATPSIRIPTITSNISMQSRQSQQVGTQVISPILPRSNNQYQLTPTVPKTTMMFPGSMTQSSMSTIINPITIMPTTTRVM